MIFVVIAKQESRFAPPTIYGFYNWSGGFLRSPHGRFLYGPKAYWG